MIGHRKLSDFNVARDRGSSGCPRVALIRASKALWLSAPRVLTLGTIQFNVFALKKGRKITCCPVFAINNGAQENLDQFSGDWNDVRGRCMPVVGRLESAAPSASGRNLYGIFPGLKPWAEGIAPSGHILP